MMNKSFFTKTKVLSLPMVIMGLILLNLAACSTMNSAVEKVKNIDLWPFDESTSNDQVRAYRPSNSSEYQCDQAKRFFVKMLDKGESVWLITKEREIALSKVGQSEYGTDNIRLSLTKNAAELTMSAETAYTNCKLVPIK
jgi:hypothetical protein